MTRPILSIPAEHRAAVREWLEALAAERWVLAEGLWDEDDFGGGDEASAEGNALYAAAEMLTPEGEVQP